MRSLALAIGSLVLSGVLAQAGQPAVINPRVTTDSTVDCSSAEAVVKQITKPDMTDEQKAVACWRFMLDHYYHWYPPKEECVPEYVRDFAKAINSYGFGPCFVNAPVLTDLWEAAGFETRSYTITGHSIPEVKYGGAWHMLDADARGWHRKEDGQIASVEELSNDAKLLTAPKEKSDPFYPFGAPDAVVKPLEPWGPPSKMMDLYLSKKDNYQYNRRAVMGHPMYLTLRSGEKITLSSANEGKWYKFGAMPDTAVASGPINVSKEITYGNGHLTYKPDLKTAQAAELLWLGSKNVKLDGGKIVAEKDGEPAVVVLRTWCPYVLVESKVLVALAGEGRPKVEISTDSGAAWAELADPVLKVGADGKSLELALEAQVAGKYEYLLRFTLEKAGISGLSYDNLFQCAPLALPRLKPGKNKVTVFRLADEGAVQLVLGNNKEAKERYIVDKQGLGDPLKSIQPAKNGEPAYVVYKLTAPEALTALSIGGQLTMDPGTPEQYIEALYSLDGGKTWTSAWKLPNHKNWGSSQFELDKKFELKNDAGAKEALIKFDMIRGSKYFAVAGVRLYGFYKQPQPAGAKLAVEIVWQEKAGDKWEEKKQAFTAEKFPQDFELTCGGEAVKLARVSMGVE
ncbi:MAG TPA: hypothetical protein PK280_15295 [Planctomycetota bacterium]|nr:hypothetical protein [Planctomycetota bacterium]